MTLRLYSHPLASFCHKVLIALYETGAPFEAHLVDLGDPPGRAAFLALWPIGKMPVLRDEARGIDLRESSVIIEHLALHYAGGTTLLPADPDEALQVRLWDRIFDNYVHIQMQKVMTDPLRPPGGGDPVGVEQARAQMRTAYAMVEHRLADGRPWVMGGQFTLADCAAAPALFYGAMAQPFEADFPGVAAYLERLKARPSYARVLAEAEPYFAMLPKPREDA